MRVTVTDFIHVRVGKPSVNAPTFLHITPGSVLDVDGKLYQGDRYEGIDTWLKDEAGNYYWRGGTNFQVPAEAEFVAEPRSIPQPRSIPLPRAAPSLVTGWHSRLRISDIWNTFNEKGNAVTIAVLDTGVVDSNSDVMGGIATEKVIITAASYPGIPLVKNDQSNEGHGTRCASIIGGRNKLGNVIGIAPECKLLSAKISINREMRNFEFVLAGIEWAINEGAEVISISYAVDLPQSQIAQWDSRFQNLIRGKNVIVLAAAGNSGSPQVTGERYPGSFDNCVSVGAVDQDNNLSAITVLSDRTIIHAPGINIESYGKLNIPDAQSGTSYATPILAGIIGLGISFLKKKNGGWDRQELLRKLFSTAVSLGNAPLKKAVNPIEFFNTLKN